MYTCTWVTYIPLLGDFLPIQITLEHWVDLPLLYSKFSLIIYFIHSSINTSTSISQFILPPTCNFLPWCPYICSLYLCLQFYSANRFLNFSRFLIFALIYDICFFDLLHSVLQSLDSPTSLQMAPFHSFLWLSNIPLYIYMPHLLYLLLY